MLGSVSPRLPDHGGLRRLQCIAFDCCVRSPSLRTMFDLARLSLRKTPILKPQGRHYFMNRRAR